MIHIHSGKPVTLALADPKGIYDFDHEEGHYKTVEGEDLKLPRPAVILLNALEPAPGERIIISRLGQDWNIARALTPKAEVKQPYPFAVRASGLRVVPDMSHAEQGNLFDRGTGTYGIPPRPRLAVASQTPYEEVLRHIMRTVKTTMREEGLDLGDGPTQKLISTIYIDWSRKGRISYDSIRERK